MPQILSALRGIAIRLGDAVTFGANLFVTQPVYAMGALNAVLDAAIGFGLPLDATQKGLIDGAVAAVSLLFVQRRVSPVLKPPTA